MKLIFKKDEDQQISVLQVIDGKQKGFTYIDMIKTLIKSNKLDEPYISKGFSEAEINSIKSMVTLINERITSINESESSDI